MLKCPSCGHEWHDEARASGGKARWKGTRKADRRAAVAQASAARWADPKARAEESERRRLWWAERKAAARAAFLRGVAESLKVSAPEADAQWAGYSRQLSDRARAKVEALGYEEGLKVGAEIAAL